VLAAIQDVAGQSAQGQMSAAEKHEKQTGEDDNAAYEHQQLA
jgi:hypothetical protein